MEGTRRWILDDGSIGDECPEPSDEERRELEVEEQRAKYQQRADSEGKELWWRGERFVPHGKETVPVPEPAPAGTRRYKVITQRDEFFGGKFDARLVNKVAADGWRVVSVATADVSTFMGTFWAGKGARQEMVVFMEKTVG